MKTTHLRQFNRRFSSISTIVIGAASALVGQSASATTGTWSGGPTGTWDTSATNWSGVSGTPWDVTNGPNNDTAFNTASLNATISGAVYTSGITFGTSGTLGGGSVNLAGTSSINVASGQTGTINSAVAGSGTLTKSGDGIAIIDGPSFNANTFNGAVVVNGGTLQMGSGAPAEGLNNATSYTVNTGGTLISANNNPLNAGATFTLNGGTLKSATSGSNFQILGQLALNGGTLESGSGYGAPFNAFALNDTLTVGGSAVSTIATQGGANSGVHLAFNAAVDGTMRTFDVADSVSGAALDLNVYAPLLDSSHTGTKAGLIKAGAGTMALFGANTYSGPTTINDGALVIVGSVGNTTITVNSQGTLIGHGAYSLDHSITLNGGSIGFYSNHVGVGSLTMNGGLLTTNDGVNSSFQSVFMTGNVTVGGSSASVIQPGGSTANGIHLADFASGGSAIRTFAVADATGNGNADLTVSAKLLNGRGDGAAVGLTKTGVGTMTLSGANTYTGATTVSQGKLVINGSISTSILSTVASGATIGGSGTVGAITVSGDLAPGASGIDINTLNAGTTIWNGGTNLWNFDLSAGAGSSDKLAIIGDFTKGTDTVFKFDFMGSAPNAWGNAYTLVTWTGTSTFLASNFSFQNLGGSYNVNDNNFTISGNSLVFTAVPEPTTAALAGLLIFAGLLRRRR